MLGDFDSLFCAGAVAALSLPHGDRLFGDDSGYHAEAHYSERKPDCFCGEQFALRERAD